MDLHYWSLNIPFKYPFTISSGTKTHQPTLVVALQLGSWVGFGEAPAISYYNVSVPQMIEVLESKRKLVEKFAFTDPERYWHYLHHLFPDHPFLVCALDMAGWDLWGKMKRKSLFQLWETPMENLPLTDYTIGIDDLDIMVNKVKENPWPVYKIKLGAGHDIAIIEAIRNMTDATLRVDVNGGWTVEEALHHIPIFQQLGVELVEQPLAKDDMEGMKVLREVSTIPLFADESCVHENDIEKCYEYFDGIVIKLTKCSGITPALRMIKQARTKGLKIMMGSMNETSIGTAAIVQLLPQVDYADADGPLLLDKNVAKGVSYDFGQVYIDPSPGLGISDIRFDFQ